MKVLVLGGYGLIGLEVCRELLAQRFAVTGLARSPERGRNLLPQADWTGADISRLTDPADWAPYLSGIDVVVNASGALQSGARDNLTRLQREAIIALIRACEELHVSDFIQVSAPGAEPGASTEFLATKGEADAALRSSRLNWVILKPGLVISSAAYGGTSLLRMLAAFPIIQPLILPSARMPTVDVRDVAAAVVRCLTDPELVGRDYDLVEPEPHELRHIVLTFRRWLGFAEPRRVIALPLILGRMVSGGADLAGHLGWRSPLRSTTLKVLGDNIKGDPEPWRRATGLALKPLSSTLADLPSTLQERLFARMALTFPLLLIILSLFWLLSGLVGLWQYEAAAALISDVTGRWLAIVLVFAGALIDLLIGGALLMRHTCRPAALAAIGVSALYLVAGSLLTPALWADPLGPLLKVLPGMALALIVAVMAEER